jgi:hypothetical protein
MDKEKKSNLIISDYYDNLERGKKSLFISALIPIMELSFNSIVKKLTGKAELKQIEADAIINFINESNN